MYGRLGCDANRVKEGKETTLPKFDVDSIEFDNPNGDESMGKVRKARFLLTREFGDRS